MRISKLNLAKAWEGSLLHALALSPAAEGWRRLLRPCRSGLCSDEGCSQHKPEVLRACPNGEASLLSPLRALEAFSAPSGMPSLFPRVCSQPCVAV